MVGGRDLVRFQWRELRADSVEVLGYLVSHFKIRSTWEQGPNVEGKRFFSRLIGFDNLEKFPRGIRASQSTQLLVKEELLPRVQIVIEFVS